MRRIATCLVFLLLVGLNLPLPAEAQKEGDAVPAFSLEDLNGNKHSPADYKGEVLVLYYLGHN